MSLLPKVNLKKLEKGLIALDPKQFERFQHMLVAHEALGIVKAIIGSPAALAMLGLAIAYVVSGKTQAVIDINACLAKCGPFDFECILDCYAKHAGKFYK